LKCGECHLRWVVGFDLKDIDAFYDAAYFASDSVHGYRNYADDADLHRHNAREILAALECRFKDRPRRVLDVGCGFGFLLDEARRAWRCEAVGVELSLSGRSYAAGRLGLEVHSAMDVDVVGPQSVDACFLIGTIEHLLDPPAMLIAINQVLKPGGRLIITTIDTRGLLPLYAIKPPEHLVYFNAANLALLLEQTGFRVESTRMFFTSYYLHDLMHRLANFFRIRPLKALSCAIARHFPLLKLRIPTNEMIVLAQKR
jgi:SAM-dependent methyltransferase